MSRYIDGLSSVYKGFLPVSQIKGTLIVAVALYLVFLGFHVTDNRTMQRKVNVERVHEGGIVLMNGTKYPVSESKESAMLPLQIGSPVQFLFVSSGEMDESIFSSLLKIVTGLLLLWLLG